MSRRQREPSNWLPRSADPYPPLFPMPNEGDHYYNTTRGILRVFRDGKWGDAGHAGGAPKDEVYIGYSFPLDSQELWVEVEAEPPVGGGGYGGRTPWSYVSYLDPASAGKEPDMDGQQWFQIEDTAQWARPTDWLPITIKAGEQALQGLVHVPSGSTSAINFTVMGAYTVDWGDGSAIQNFDSNVQATHTYTGANLPANTENSLGQRQARFTIRPQGTGTLTKWTHTTPANVTFGLTEIVNAATTLTSFIREPNAATYYKSPLKHINTLVPLTLPITNSPMVPIFRGNVLLQAISGTFDFPLLTDYTYLFYGDAALQHLPTMDTRLGTNFFGMFSGCAALTSVPKLNTSLGINFSGMFSGCAALTDVPLFDTSNGTNFSSLFSGCTALRTVPYLNTSNGTNFNSMLAGAGMTTFPAFDTSKGTDFTAFVRACPNLTAVPMLNTNSGTKFQSTFSECPVLTTVPLWDTSNATDVSFMFYRSKAITTVPQFNVSKVGASEAMFYECDELRTVPALNYTDACFRMGSMFQRCYKLTSVGGLGAPTKVGDLSSLFYMCSSLVAAPPISGTSSVYGWSNMFEGCTSLTTVPAYDMSGSTSTQGQPSYNNMFKDCLALTNIDAYGWVNDLNIQDTAMTGANLNKLMNNLGPPKTPGTTKLNFYDAVGMYDADPNIALGKSWDVSPRPMASGGTMWKRRPADWLPVTVQPGEQKIQILALINSSTASYNNTVKFKASGAYTVDWGDGSALQNFAAGAIATKVYTFASLPNNAISTGQRQVQITVTPQAGQTLTRWSGEPITGGSSGTYPKDAITEVINGAPTLVKFIVDTQGWYRNGLIHAGTLTQIRLESMNYIFVDSALLRGVTGPWGISPTAGSFNGAFQDCYLLEDVPDTLPGIENVTTVQRLFLGCQSLKKIPLWDTSNSTNFINAFTDCRAAKTIPAYEINGGSDYWYIYGHCMALTEVPAVDFSTATGMTGAFVNCPKLKSFKAYGCRVSFDVSGTQLDAAALNLMFSNLGTPIDSNQKVTIGGVPGAATCNKSIATNKGWIVV